MMEGGLLNMGSGAGVAPQNFHGDEQEQQPNVSPEEQADYDLFVKNGMEALYTEDNAAVRPEVLKRLGTGNPSTALAQTAVWLVMLTEKSAETNGKDVTDDVVMHGGRELLEQLAEIAETAKLHTFSPKELDGAWYSALDLYREANTDDGQSGGRIKPQVAAQEFNALNEADKEGRADEILPGFNRIAAQQHSEVSQQEAKGEVDRGGEGAV